MASCWCHPYKSLPITPPICQSMSPFFYHTTAAGTPSPCPGSADATPAGTHSRSPGTCPGTPPPAHRISCTCSCTDNIPNLGCVNIPNLGLVRFRCAFVALSLRLPNPPSLNHARAILPRVPKSGSLPGVRVQPPKSQTPQTTHITFS